MHFKQQGNNRLFESVLMGNAVSLLHCLLVYRDCKALGSRSNKLACYSHYNMAEIPNLPPTCPVSPLLSLLAHEAHIFQGDATNACMMCTQVNVRICYKDLG